MRNVRGSKAVWFTGPRLVEIREEEKTQNHPLKENEVRARSLFSGISAGTEMLVYQGKAPKELSLGLGSSENTKFVYPFKYGYCDVAEIIDVGHNCSSLKMGERIFALNPHEEEFTIDENFCVTIPQDIDPKVATFLANIETAIGLIHDGEMRLGESIAIFGLGVVGLLTLSILTSNRLHGKIVGIDPIEKRRRLARRFGADEVADPRDLKAGTCTDFNTPDNRPDLIFELSGTPSVLQDAVDLAGFETRIVVGSWYGEKEAPINLGRSFHRNRNRIISSQVANLNPALLGRWNKKRRMDLTINFLRKLLLKELITDVFSIDDAPLAYRKIAEQPEETLQVILEYPK